MKFIFALIMGLSISSVAGAGEGLPLPWPFPWAEDCPINWENLEGRYMLSNTAAEEQLELSITLVTHMGFRMIRLAHMSNRGEVISEGFNFISLNQRTIWLQLYPTDQDAPTVSAMIKLYYQTSTRACSDKNLIPILTIEHEGSTSTRSTQYRLIRMKALNGLKKG